MSVTNQFTNYCFCRNPYSRIVSAYLDKFCGEDKTKSWVRAIIDDVGGKDRLSFKHFLEYIAQFPAAELNPHWRPQSVVLKNAQSMCYIKIEDFNNEMQKFGLGSDKYQEHPIKARQRTHYNRAFPKVDVSDVPLETLRREIDVNSGAPPASQFLTEDTISLCTAIYADDFFWFIAHYRGKRLGS